MIDALTTWIAGHAAEVLAALIITGAISLAAQLDSMLKNAGPGAPMWLKIASRVLSHLARNVGRAESGDGVQGVEMGLKQKLFGGAKAFAPVLLIPLAALAIGCVTVNDESLQARGMAEGYDVSGPSVTIGADGSVECKSDDPAAHPCRARYAAGWEAWPPVLEVLATPFEAILQLVGRSLEGGS